MYIKYIRENVENQYNVIPRVVSFIVENYSPVQIVLFGSCAKGCARTRSDIDLCIVMNYNDDEKTTIINNMFEGLYEIIEYDLDIILYKPEQWERLSEDASTFAGLIKKTGEIIYG